MECEIEQKYHHQGLIDNFGINLPPEVVEALQKLKNARKDNDAACPMSERDLTKLFNSIRDRHETWCGVVCLIEFSLYSEYQKGTLRLACPQPLHEAVEKSKKDAQKFKDAKARAEADVFEMADRMHQAERKSQDAERKCQDAEKKISEMADQMRQMELQIETLKRTLPTPPIQVNEVKPSSDRYNYNSLF